MTADGNRLIVVLRGSDGAPTHRAEEGDRLRAVGIRRADGDFNALTAPIIATLDEVIARRDASERLVAEYAKGDLLLCLQTRMRDAIPHMTPRMSLAEAQDIERRHQALEPKLAPWAREATGAFRRVVQIARENPNITNGNSVIQYMGHEAERPTG